MKTRRNTTHIIVLTILGLACLVLISLYYVSKTDSSLQKTSVWERVFTTDSLRYSYSFVTGTYVFKVYTQNNNIYIQNWTEKNVQRVDSLGKVLSTIGSKGSGPGQFKQISSVGLSNTSIFVTDNINMKISQFDSMGLLQRDYSIEKVFSKSARLSDSVFLLQTERNGTSQIEQFEKVNLYTRITTPIQVQRLERSQSNDPAILGMETRGYFVENKNNKIFRISSKIGQFIAFDTLGNHLYSQYTIDRTKAPEVTKKGNADQSVIQYGENSRDINIFASADNQYLYVLSNAPTPQIAESKKGVNKDAVIDVYHVNDGKYKCSFFLRLPSSAKSLPISIHVDSNRRLYAVDGVSVFCYLLPQSIFDSKP